jgi:hypothetical protein
MRRVTSDPYWVPDYNIVPRYRYRPEDDRIDTSQSAKPAAPDKGARRCAFYGQKNPGLRSKP